jgi:DNA-binding protein H-NS
MARPKNLALMPVDALLKMRAEIGAVLSRKAADLQRQLASVGSYGGLGRTSRRKSLAGRKVAPKYRSPAGETWAGRGAQPRWLTAAIKSGKKRNDFLIEKKSKRAKRTRRKK